MRLHTLSDKTRAISVLVAGFIAMAGVVWQQNTPFLTPEPERTPGPEFKMVTVPAGTFSITYSIFNSSGKKLVRKTAQLPSFEIGTYEVSAAQWQACVTAGACRKPSQSMAPNMPATAISFQDAMAFIDWLNKLQTTYIYRLPTEEEWLYAAQAGQNFTEEFNDFYRLTTGFEKQQTQPLGTFGANAWGMFDTAGSVWEWTLTCWHASEEKIAAPSSAQALNNLEACGVRTVMGLERAHVPFFIRTAYGGGCSTGTPPSHLGFRLVRFPRSEAGLS